MPFTDLHALLSPVDQLESIPASEIITSSVKRPARARFIASVSRCCFWGHSVVVGPNESDSPLRSFPNVWLSSAPSVRGWQRVDGRRWEPNGQMRGHDTTGVLMVSGAEIGALGGGFAHICNVWKPDSTGVSAQAHRARAGQQKFRPDVFTELQSTAGVGMPKPKKGTTEILFPTDEEGKGLPAHLCLHVSGFGKGMKSGHPTR